MTATTDGELIGLTSDQVADRVARGETNDAPDAHSRSLSSIIRANTLTWFNFLIGSLWIVMLMVAPWQDSLFGFVIVANTLIGTTQEYRASRALAKLAVIGEAKPIVVRDGVEIPVNSKDVVLGDLIAIKIGDQLVVDGVVAQSHGLEIDESLLTGEADPVDKHSGDQVMSGSFVVAGSGYFTATRVGRDSFAAGLTEQAKKFQKTDSELRDSINKFIRYVSYFLLPVGTLLLLSQLFRAKLPLDEALRGTIAGVVTMVPEGLVLLTSIAMAVSVIALARKRVLVQDLPAVEVLARVDTVCADKTGTLTEPGMQVQELVILDEATTDPSESSQVLGAMAAIDDSPNPTLNAIAAKFPAPDWSLVSNVPFSSARKWSAATFSDHGTWIIGAPEMVDPTNTAMRSKANEYASTGARVLVLARNPAPVTAESVLEGVTCVALVVISQTLRPDAEPTVQYFLDQGVNVKVISGDNAETVGAIAKQAGVPGADHPYDARHLPTTTAAVADVLAVENVFGRVSPSQKQGMVDALHTRGKTVAMTGDGVNDVLALKSADLGIAMGSGAGATRAVAQIVLLDDQWSVMPSVVAQGRKVLGNIERVADVFLTKSFYAMIISTATAIFAVAFPFLPRHLTLISALTIGIPGFFLALMPNTERFRPGFFNRVLLFAIPAGVIAAISAFASYGAALYFDESIENAQSAATITLFIVTIAVLAQSARPLNLIRIGVVALMVVMFVAVLYTPFLSDFFELSLGPERYSIISIVVGLAGAVAVLLVTLFTDKWRRAPKVEVIS
jgi:cation-transporting P-type ATPase E